MNDRIAVFALPRPKALQKFFAAKIVPGLAFFGKLALNDILGGDAGMIGARHPERFEPTHPFIPDHDILQGVVEGVTHVQNASHIGRRDNDRIGLFVRIDFGVKKVVVDPILAPFGVDFVEIKA